MDYKEVFSDIDMSCLSSQTYSIVSMVVNITVSAATIFGNMLILISIYKYPTIFKDSLYKFIGNLAIADLLLGLWLLLYLYEEIVPDIQSNWYFCIAKPVGALISYTCSCFSLLAIAADRFLAILFPLRHLGLKQNNIYSNSIILLIWILSFIPGILAFMIMHPKLDGNTFLCRTGAVLPREYELLPLGLLGIGVINYTLYGIILRHIRSTRITGTNSAYKKIAKTIMMLVVLTVFVVSWFPFIICSCLMQFKLPSNVFRNILCAREYLVQLGFLNSALNPAIYGLANKKFKTAFKKLLCCK